MSAVRIHLGAAFALLLAFATPLGAQTTTPQPILTSISPAAAQAGTTVEMTVIGKDLDGASRLHFSVPGAVALPKVDEKTNAPVVGKFVVTIPKGLAAGVCDVRVVSRYGVSNPRGFVISALPVLQIPATAVSAETAFKAELNTTLTGAAVKQSDVLIQVEAKKGQRIIAVCQPLLLDSRMEADVSLRDASNFKVGRLQPDGLLDHTATSDGKLTIAIHDLMFRGDAEYPFVLTLTAGPVVQYAFDGGATWTLYGRNLPKGEKVTTRYGAAFERAVMPAVEARKLVDANAVKVIRFGKEDSAPSAAQTPVTLTLPSRHTGWFAADGQPRYFSFTAKKGDVFWIEVNCARKGIAADPYFVVMKDDAFIAEASDRPEVAAKGEFESGIADPVYRFEAKADGVHRIKLRNLYSNAPEEPFEMAIQPAGSNYKLVAVPLAAPKAKAATTAEVNTSNVWRGGVSVLKVYALRSGGFTAAIPLSVDGLPADVKFLGGQIAEGQNVGYAAFAADDAAKEWGGPVVIKGPDGGAATGASLLFNVGNTAKESVLTRLTDETVLGVSEAEAPIAIEAATAVVESDGKAKLTIPLQAKRKGDFTDAVKLTSVGIEGLTADIAAKGVAGSLVVDVAKLKLPPGDHTVILQSAVKFKHKRIGDPKAAPKDVTGLVNSKPITLRVKKP